MSDRWIDWLGQAERDLEHAEMDTRNDFFEWACFSAQQAAEKALKAVFVFRNEEGWGHSVAALLRKLPLTEEQVRSSSEAVSSQGLAEKAGKLDRFYVPTRYANGFENGAPREYFFRSDADEAISHARAIISYCKGLLPR